jgi:hypothetical protein
MITGALPTEEKDRCQTFLNGKYVPSEIVGVHMTPLQKSIKVEVITTQGTFIHHLRKKPCGHYEEYPLSGNDR